MKRFIIVLIVALFLVPACGLFRAREEKTADELARIGMDAFQNGKYRKAIEAFEKIKDWYPFSEHAILAELKTADSYYELKEYEEAVFSYDEFEKLHPRNDAVPYVIFRIGQCYFNQMDSKDRDQTATKNALTIFNRLVNQYPDAVYSQRAERYIKTCRKKLAEHEFYIGLYYFKNKKYEAALSRFMAILSDYPDVGVHRKALEYIAKCRAQLQSSNI